MLLSYISHYCTYRFSFADFSEFSRPTKIMTLSNDFHYAQSFYYHTKVLLCCNTQCMLQSSLTHDVEPWDITSMNISMYHGEWPPYTMTPPCFPAKPEKIFGLHRGFIWKICLNCFSRCFINEISHYFANISGEIGGFRQNFAIDTKKTMRFSGLKFEKIKMI